MLAKVGLVIIQFDSGVGEFANLRRVSKLSLHAGSSPLGIGAAAAVIGGGLKVVSKTE